MENFDFKNEKFIMFDFYGGDTPIKHNYTQEQLSKLYNTLPKCNGVAPIVSLPYPNGRYYIMQKGNSLLYTDRKHETNKFSRLQNGKILFDLTFAKVELEPDFDTECTHFDKRLVDEIKKLDRLDFVEGYAVCQTKCLEVTGYSNGSNDYSPIWVRLKIVNIYQ